MLHIINKKLCSATSHSNAIQILIQRAQISQRNQISHKSITGTSLNGTTRYYNDCRWKRRDFSTSTEKPSDVAIEECLQDIKIIGKHIASSKGSGGVVVELIGVEKEFTKILPIKKRRELRELKEKIVSKETSTIATKEKDIAEPTKHALKLHMLNQGIPFVGFGIMDNAILIWAGDQIDISLGVVLGLSTMCAAAIGNIISDVAGVALGTMIEDLCAKLRLPVAKLTNSQRQLRSVRFAGQFGTAFGLTIGCIIGMFPLLFIDTEKREKMKQASCAEEALFNKKYSSDSSNFCFLQVLLSCFIES